MAKNKKNSLDIENSILKEFGNVFQNPTKLVEEPPKVINTTPKMDIMLSGGIPEGSFVVISGKPGLGKSAMALQIAANAQKIPSKYGDRTVYYFDIEGRIKKRDLFNNHNLDTSEDRFKLIKSSEEKIIMGEEFIDIGEKLIHASPGSVFIFDSFSAICTSKRHEAKISDRYRDDAPLLLASFCARISQAIPVKRCIVIGITHIIANQGYGMKTTQEASGNKIQYRADVKINGQFMSPWTVGNEVIGQEVHWECTKSALGQPNDKSICKLRYNYGYDDIAELVDVGVDLGIIKKGGAWFTYIPEKSKEEIKFQGQEKLVNHLKSNKDIYDMLYNEIYDGYLNANKI